MNKEKVIRIAFIAFFSTILVVYFISNIDRVIEGVKSALDCYL